MLRTNGDEFSGVDDEWDKFNDFVVYASVLLLIVRLMQTTRQLNRVYLGYRFVSRIFIGSAILCKNLDFGFFK